MKELLEGAMELPLDKYRIKINQLKEELAAARAKAESDRAQIESNRDKALEENKLLKQKLAELPK